MCDRERERDAGVRARWQNRDNYKTDEIPRRCPRSRNKLSRNLLRENYWGGKRREGASRGGRGVKLSTSWKMENGSPKTAERQ